MKVSSSVGSSDGNREGKFDVSPLREYIFGSVARYEVSYYFGSTDGKVSFSIEISDGNR